MELKHVNDINLGQTLSINSRTQQSLEILAMASYELDTFIQDQFMDNPVIELDSNEGTGDEESSLDLKLKWLEELDYSRRHNDRDIVDYDSEYSYDAEQKDETLYCHLHSQLILLPLSSQEFYVCEYIIQMLDENGFLDIDLGEIGRLLETELDFVYKCLQIVWTLEPTGVGARDLKECLILQLKNKNITNKNVFEIVERFMDKVSQNNLNFISKKLKLSIEAVKEAVNILRLLNPYPGRAFGGKQEVSYIKPDVYILNFQDNLEIIINEHSYPGIRISKYYKNVLYLNSDDKIKKYIERKVLQAEWISKCISNRNNTLYKVVSQIVKLQSEFFEKGIGNLRPLRLQDIAEEIGIHQSTVSRAINNKYLQCAWGMFKLKYFFTWSGFEENENKNDTSSKIKLVINNIIKNEDKNDPYSDNKLSDILEKMGYSVARRTVAKYRESMGVLPAAQRKVYQDKL